MINSVNQARRILTAIAVFFALIDIAAIAILVSPLGRGNRDAEYQQLREERLQKEADTRPTKDMDKKLVLSREAIAGFYDNRLPANYSEISEDLGKTATAHHVTLSQVRYEAKPTGLAGLNRVTMTINVTGDYVSEMNFINAIERDKKFYVLDHVTIGDAGNGNQLRVELQLDTFLRNAA